MAARRAHNPKVGGSNPSSATTLCGGVALPKLKLWHEEKYPRGRRGSPAKGVVRETVARVQIPLSPPHHRTVNAVLFCCRKRNAKNSN